MRRILYILILLLPIYVNGQIKLDKHKHDFGEIVRGTDRVVDFTFTNTGNDAAIVLRARFEFEYDILWSGKEIKADSSLTLRVKYNPRVKGKFREEVEVYFSSMMDPIVLQFSGDVQFIDNSENPACPSFRDRPRGCCPDSDDGMLFEVFDARTKEPIKKARIQIVKNGRVSEDLSTDREGQVSANLEPSWYLMDVSASGYLTVDSANYINRRLNHYVFFLEMDQRDAIDVPLAMNELPPSKIEEISPEEVELITQPLPEFDPFEEETPQYKQNNLVLLVDVSQSMAGQGKLDLLKSAVYELSQVLRPVDKVTIVTYATQTEVVLEAVNGAESETIMEQVSALQAGGMTMGSKGFNRAFDLLNKHFIEGGNNELIVVTDGAFRSSDNPRILNLVKENAEKGVVTSILGIKGYDKDSEKLNEIVTEGMGNYLQINSLDESQFVLINEVRIQSSY